MGICLHYEAVAINHDRHFIPLKDGVMDTAISLLGHSLETGGQRSGFSCHFGGWEMAESGQCFPHPVSPHASSNTNACAGKRPKGYQHRTWT